MENKKYRTADHRRVQKKLKKKRCVQVKVQISNRKLFSCKLIYGKNLVV